jgi:uncharacterized iron-regulated protein/predicted esterase
MFLFLTTALVACTAPTVPESHARESSEPWAAPPLERALSARDGRTGESIALDELFDRLARADVVFLGETHIDETTHRLELAAYEALLARRAGRVVLALEFFERDVQPALDAYLAGAIDEPTFLSKARPWSNYASAYRPLIEHAKSHKGPVVASNFPAPLRKSVATDGIAALAQLSGDRKRDAPAALLPETPAYWRRVDNATRSHAGMMGAAAAPDDSRLLDTQCLWDNAMGESCARALDEHPGALVLHMNGGFHSAYWDGSVRQLRLRKPDARVLTVAIDPVDHPASADIRGVPSADYVVFVESRAKDVDEGAYAVDTTRELKYRLALPKPTRESAPVPLLIWLGDDGESARESLAEWRELLGENVAIAAIEAPYRETQEDLVEGGRWFWPDTFTEDVATLEGGITDVWAFLLRHYAIDPTRVCLAGKGTGATVAAATAMLTPSMDVRAVALAPRRFAKIKDFPLPLPELAGDERKAEKSLRLLASAGDEAWWSSEIDAYRGIGLACELGAASGDPWQRDLERENAVRSALGLGAHVVAADAPRRYVLAESPRAREWARRIASRQSSKSGELVAVLSAPPAAGTATELPTAVHAGDFAAGRALPRCPGAFGGTTIVALPANLPSTEVDAWLALEKDDPLAKQSRFHRLRIATASGERALPAVLAALREKGRQNVLIVPAVFCADGASMRALQTSVRELDDRMTLRWQPGLGSLGSDVE